MTTRMSRICFAFILAVILFFVALLLGATARDADAQTIQSEVTTYESQWINMPPYSHVTVHHPFHALPSTLTLWCLIEWDNGDGIDAIPCANQVDTCVYMEHADAGLIHFMNTCDAFVDVRVDAIFFIPSAIVETER